MQSVHISRHIRILPESDHRMATLIHCSFSGLRWRAVLDIYPTCHVLYARLSDIAVTVVNSCQAYLDALASGFHFWKLIGKDLWKPEILILTLCPRTIGYFQLLELSFVVNDYLSKAWLHCGIWFISEHDKWLLFVAEITQQSHVHEIKEDWKPSFLSNDEFAQLMLEVRVDCCLTVTLLPPFCRVIPLVVSLGIPQKSQCKFMHGILPVPYI